MDLADTDLEEKTQKMEKEEVNALTGGGGRVLSLKPSSMEEAEKFSLQWGSKKRLRCIRFRGANNNNNNVINPPLSAKTLSSSSPDDNNNDTTSSPATKIHRKILTISHKEASFPSSNTSRQASRNMESGTNRSEKRPKVSIVEKEERIYMTRGSTASEENIKKMKKKTNKVDVGFVEKQHEDDHQLPLNNQSNNNNKVGDDDTCINKSDNNKKLEWPKLYLALSSKEKEEDFMAMKGCRLPHRPKKRAKVVQRTLLLVSPGAWLTEMSWERYEVRDNKKTSKKKARGGLKGMGNSVDSDSD